MFVDILAQCFLCALHGMRMVSGVVWETIEKTSSSVKHLDPIHFLWLQLCHTCGPAFIYTDAYLQPLMRNRWVQVSTAIMNAGITGFMVVSVPLGSFFMSELVCVCVCVCEHMCTCPCILGWYLVTKETYMTSSRVISKFPNFDPVNN